MNMDSKLRKKAQPAVPVVVRLPEKLVSQLDKKAESNFTSRSMLVRQMLVAGLKRGGVV
jgi:metal-responsive CopG/Arc/MetJ family transcriptional regulator